MKIPKCHAWHQNRVDAKLPRLILVTDGSSSNRSCFLEKINEAIETGVEAIQIREKHLSTKELDHLVEDIKKMNHKIRLFINDRLDVALSQELTGVHCPESGIPPKEIKQIWPHITIGMSVHSSQTAALAEKEKADFLFFGTIFPTLCKPNQRILQGLDKLKEIVKTVNIPVFAIGGIKPDHVKSCLQVGAYGIAVRGGILSAPSITRAVRTYQDAIRHN